MEQNQCRMNRTTYTTVLYNGIVVCGKSCSSQFHKLERSLTVQLSPILVKAKLRISFEQTTYNRIIDPSYGRTDRPTTHSPRASVSPLPASECFNSSQFSVQTKTGLVLLAAPPPVCIDDFKDNLEAKQLSGPWLTASTDYTCTDSFPLYIITIVRVLTCFRILHQVK